MEIKDKHSRVLRDLRISVTDRCNFRCRYCMPEEIFGDSYEFLPKEHILSVDEIARVARLFRALGVEKIRITGGEPLLRKDLPEIIERIAAINGIHDIALTTNGSLLRKHARKLKEVGLDRVAVSLDALDNDTFLQMNGGRSKVQPVLEGIDAAHEAGLKVKVNMVVQKGVNDQSILPMAALFREKGHILRFIEYMDVGNSNGWNWNQVISKSDIVKLIEQQWELEPVEANYRGEVATRYRYTDGLGEIGIISSVSDAFCSTCTRARLSAEGKLYTCLFAADGHDIRSMLRSGQSDEEIIALLAAIWSRREDRYSMERGSGVASSRSKVEMSHIGG